MKNHDSAIGINGFAPEYARPYLEISEITREPMYRLPRKWEVIISARHTSGYTRDAYQALQSYEPKNIGLPAFMARRGITPISTKHTLTGWNMTRNMPPIGSGNRADGGGVRMDAERPLGCAGRVVARVPVFRNIVRQHARSFFCPVLSGLGRGTYSRAAYRHTHTRVCRDTPLTEFPTWPKTLLSLPA